MGGKPFLSCQLELALRETHVAVSTRDADRARELTEALVGVLQRADERPCAHAAPAGLQPAHPALSPTVTHHRAVCNQASAWSIPRTRRPSSGKTHRGSICGDRTT